MPKMKRMNKHMNLWQQAQNPVVGFCYNFAISSDSSNQIRDILTKVG